MALSKYITGILLFLVVTVSAQQAAMFPLQEQKEIVTFQLAPNIGHQPLQIIVDSVKLTVLDLSTEKNIRLIDADLFLDFFPAKTSRHFRYDFTAKVTYTSDLSMPVTFYGDQNRGEEKVTINWADFTEKGIYPGTKVSMLISRELFGDVDCQSSLPLFEPRWKKPAFALLGLGVVSLTGSSFLSRNTNKSTDVYRDLWEAGESADAADPIKRQADEARREQTIFLYSGVAIIAVAGTYLTSHYLKLRRQRKTYNKYCERGSAAALQLDPIIFSVDSRLAFGACLSWKISKNEIR